MRLHSGYSAKIVKLNGNTLSAKFAKNKEHIEILPRTYTTCPAKAGENHRVITEFHRESRYL